MLFSLTVGKVDAGVAVLLTEDKRLIEFPSILLPPNISSGSIVNVDVSRNLPAENRVTKSFETLQSQILSNFGSQSPSPPILRCRNATQTSIVLEWDPIALATARIRSLSLYRNGNKAGAIPRPLEITSTKISGLAVDTEYNFSLLLKTSAGTYSSEKLTVRTHKMTELHGITVTPGILPRETREELEETMDRIGGKLIEQVRIDTTHFVCTEGRGSAWEKATDMNIPIVLPEWVTACEQEGRLVGVRSYYLNNADPRAKSIGSGSQSQSSSQRPAADRRASQPASVRNQPLPITKITPPTPEVGTPDTPTRRTADREPPSPFTKVDETDEEKTVELPSRAVDGGIGVENEELSTEGPGKDEEEHAENASAAEGTTDDALSAKEVAESSSANGASQEGERAAEEPRTSEASEAASETFDEVKL